ncbi:hypothetical protein [Alkalihalobacillus sp. LMS39]|uniref:hypothetical protein n=1 Tax=Alkalihalobacillus sp. LMS39 TaxID=2924032 RepID=UPI001FB4A657|nr:hypothetical protein [Alkalihalobacillus sp. LMS39]UOE95984.1 hypothetical protein MM271_10445 [Alkalihalobacillus sp. LMS39]
MLARRHTIFNIVMILIPWLSLCFVDKTKVRRYALSSVIIGMFEIINHIYGHQRNWWKFYDKPKSFLKDELPFDLGPYMPLSIWMLSLSYGNFKKFVLLNALTNAFFTFVFMPFLKTIKILQLDRLNYVQFFIYIHYKAYLLYALQYGLEKARLTQ